MVNSEIKIVGAVSDESALEEIENIAKVFAYEQRMKDYTPLVRPSYQVKKIQTITENKNGGNGKTIENLLPHIPVKGLC